MLSDAGCSTGDSTCVSGAALQPYLQGALDAVQKPPAVSRHCPLKAEHLSRQARDKTQETLKKTILQVEYVTGNVSTIWGGKRAAAVRKAPLFVPFIYKNDLFTKTGSGQT